VHIEKETGKTMNPFAKDRDVVIYDGECSFCRGQVERLQKWDTGDRLRFLSLHDEAVVQLLPDLSHDELMKQMYVVDRRGRRYGGAGAVRYLSRRLPRLWYLVPLLHLPGSLWLWDRLYQLVARRRYHWGGSCSTTPGGACSVETSNAQANSGEA
jgi:predicted DCC family thiol-disulfide oxidoreductase YuxK